jgi:hypothetical protein
MDSKAGDKDGGWVLRTDHRHVYGLRDPRFGFESVVSDVDGRWRWCEEGTSYSTLRVAGSYAVINRYDLFSNETYRQTSRQ